MSNNPYLISANTFALGSTTAVVTAGQIAGVSNPGAQSSNPHDVILVAIGDSGTATVTSVADTQGNVYRQINSDITQASVFQWRSAGDTKALVAGTDTVTVTFSGSGNTKTIAVIGIPGVQPAHDNLALPASVASAGATSASITSGTFAEANEVVVAITASGNAAGTPASAAGWTQVTAERQPSSQWLTVAYKVVSSTSPVTATTSFGASVHFGMLLSSYIIPTATFPYVAGTGQAPSGGATTLPVALRAPVNAGDTIQVGALATAGSVTGVTDTAGNTYALTKSETANTASQLYVFSSYNSAPMTPQQTAPGAARFGCTANTGLYAGDGGLRLTAAQDFDNVIAAGPPSEAAAPIGVSCQKVYYNPGTFPTSLTDQSGHDLTPLVNAGCRFWLCYKPAAGGTDLTAFQNSVAFWLTKTTNIAVVIWQEPQSNSNSGALGGASDFIARFRAYAPMLHSLGVQTVYDADGTTASEWTSFYPGNSYVDIVAIDFYGSGWKIMTHSGTTDLDPLQPIRNLADSNGKPFGLGEIGQAAGGATVSTALFEQYMTYLTNTMGARILSGAPTSDVMWFNGKQGNPGDVNQIVSGDFRIPYIQNLRNALLTSTGAGFTVTYSTNASAQAAIAIGDNGVSGGGDVAVGATATTGTTASVATGTLADAEEHIIAFEANLAAGGVPAVGDSLILGDTIEGGTSAFLTGAYKTVSTNASDTPSFTIASTTWSIVAVTDPVAQLIITTSPPAGQVSVAYSSQMASIDGVGAVTWSSTGTLPPGLSFSAGGLLSGTPTTAGSYTPTLTATDSLGATASITPTVAITAAPIASVVPAFALHNNILSLTDQDFETGIGTWASFVNAGSLTNASANSVTGTHGLQWTAPAAGALSQVATGLYPVLPNQPYIASCFLFSGAQRQVNIGVAWYDITSALIAVAQANPVSSSPSAWLPLTNALVSPGNAAFGEVVVSVASPQAGDVFTIDTVYFTLSDTQILIDWINPTFTEGGQAGAAFMDCSPWLRLDTPLNYTRGRQDAISEIQPGSCTFVMQNDNGEFTRYGLNTIPGAIGGAVTNMRRFQLNIADETVQWWTRFDGPLSELDYTFDNTGNTCTMNVSVTDVLAFLNREDPLFCWTKSQVLSDEPLYHWTLDDPGNVGGTGVGAEGGFGVGAETSGANGPPMRLSSSDSTNVATIAWQDTSGGVETLADAVKPQTPDGSEFWTPGLNQPSQTNRGLDSGNVGPYTAPLSSVTLTPVRVAQSAQNLFIGNTGYMLSTELAQPLFSPPGDANGYTLETWVTVDPQVFAHAGSNYGPYVALSLGSSRSYSCLVLGLFLQSGSVYWGAQTLNQPPSFRGLNYPGSPLPTAVTLTNTTPGAGDTAKVPHHLVLDVLYDSGTGFQVATLYVDGVLVGSGTLPAGQSYDTICVGGAFGGTGSWYGNISLVSVYPYQLTPFQVSQHCQLGQYGMWETTADDAVAQIAEYTGVPAFWNNIAAQHLGLTLMEYSDITGSNGLANMQVFEQAEAGLIYVNASGALNFHTRDWRSGYPAPDLLLPPYVFDGNMQYEMVDQFQSNEYAVSTPATQGATSAFASLTGNLSTGPTNTTTSGVLQASYVNSASQDDYGTYTTSGVGSPTALPLITWSRAYAQLAIPSAAYVPDPNLSDRAAWQANSRAEPYFMPAQLIVDLLSIAKDPSIGLGPSNFYALDIDNMVAPTGTLPASFPNATGSTEWFIEGITESKGINVHTIQFFCSPAEPQRAWVPGDPVYGVLGSTTRLGISAADLSVPQADGKDVSHDAGEPYWPPAFGSTMNNPDGSGNGFIGAADMRGIAGNLQELLTPAMLHVATALDNQTIVNGALSDPTIYWDFIHVDTEGGMGAIPGWPNWYVVTRPGWYELDANVTWSQTGAQAGYTAQAWIAVAQGAAQALAAGTGTPRTVSQYVCPVGDGARMNSVSLTPINAMSTRMYLGLGDMVAVCAEHNWTASRGTSTAGAGCALSMVRTGIGTVDDRTEVNSSLASGGTVTIPVKGTLKQVIFSNTHNYCYHGAASSTPYARRSSDLACFQGLSSSGSSNGSQTSQIAFNVAAIQAALTGHQIQSATLQATNTGVFSSASSSRMILGTTTATPGGTTYHPTTSNSKVNLWQQVFQEGQELTFIIPVSMVKPFVTGSQTAFVLGDSQTTDPRRYGSWQGGPGAWILTVNYV